MSITTIQKHTKRPPQIRALIVLIALALTSMACGMLNTITGGSGAEVAELWTDVPKLEGATKTAAEVPPAVRLLASQALGAKFDFVVYKATQTPDEVKAFYSKERMQGLGWNSDGGCTSISADTAGGSSPGGGFCTFTRVEDGKTSTLLIAITQSDNSKEAQLIYLRAILPPTPVP
jgi:hypothetical protein